MRLVSRWQLGLGLLALCSTPLALFAQTSSPPSHWEHVSVRSGLHANSTPVEGVVWRELVVLPQGTPWLRLYYSKVFLDKGSYLRIVSLRDGDFMTMRQEHMEQWSYSSCYFNGNSVMLEIVAGPNTQKNYVEIDKVMAGDITPVTPQPETICGANDDRTPSSHAATGRIDPIGCTGWIIDLPAAGNDKCHLSAGHCFSNGQILEFNVPASGANCALFHPPAAKQFAINAATSQSLNGGIGNDFWVFRCFPNSTTGLTTFQEQGFAWTLSPTIPAVNTTLRNYGYGLDGTNVNGAGGGNTPNCFCTAGNGTGTRNQTQQTHTGPLTGAPGTQLDYQVDTCGGNSGSPVSDNGNGLAVGIHTHGGCSNPLGTTANHGTQITHAGLQAAIAIVCAGTGSQPNNECAGATQVFAGVNGPFNNANATLSAPAFPCGFSVGQDVWFRLNSCAGSYTISTCTATRTLDTVLEVFSGSCGSLTSVACNDDSCGLGSSLTIALAAGTYYIRVGGYNGASGNFDLSITAPCYVNDECSAALPLSLGVNGPFDNINASTSLPVWPCGAGGRDVWYTYDVPCDNLAVTITTCNPGTSYDTTLQVFDGSCGSLVSLGCNDDMGSLLCSTNGLLSQLVLTPTAGRLYIRVGGFGGLTGTFFLTVSQTPTDNECVDAISVSNGVNGPFCTIGATTSAPAWPCAGGGSDVWFSYTATCTGNLTVSTCTAARTYDTAVQVFSGSCGSLISLGCNDDAGGGCGLGSSLTVPVTFGQVYLIRLGGFLGATGIAELAVSCVHPTDECATAALVVDGVNGPFSTAFATSSAPAWPCGPGSNDCWFRYTANCTCPHTFTTCTPTRTFDTVLQVFSGGCAVLANVGCNDDAGGACGLGSRLTVNLISGQTYHIRVGGFGVATGNFDLGVEPGTGTGGFSTIPHGCGPMSISVGGQPRIGGTINTSIAGFGPGLPFIGLGFLPGAPFCTCTIGHSWVSANFGSLHNLFIPCDPIFIGNQVGIQGAGFLTPGGCPAPQVSFTNTVVVTIG